MTTWRRYLSTPELGDAIRDIMDFYNELYADRAEDTVRQVVGEGDPDMAKWLLERTRAEKYSNKQKVDTDVRVTVKVQEF
jgi:succinate dehydrogenase flavin-adding protein (antitoxin of CptAB toxin-antitoxin module)